jgi:hypothetical protein
MALILRILKRLGLIFLAFLVIYAVGRPVQIWLDGFYTGDRGPYLQMMSSNAVTIRWQSKNQFKGVVKMTVFKEQISGLKHLQKLKLIVINRYGFG